MKDTDQPILHKDGVSYVLPFILVTCCFALCKLEHFRLNFDKIQELLREFDITEDMII